MKREHFVLLAALAATLLVAGCTEQMPDQFDSATSGNDDTTTDGANTPTGESEGTDSGDDGQNTVRYTSNGFEPSTIRINQGESVTWINDGGPAMWVASDIHPSHRSYDGTSVREHCSNGQSDTFDQCSTGRRYTFTFDRAGTWGYHNHQNAGHSGTVVVQ
jgi:plastocyanin